MKLNLLLGFCFSMALLFVIACQKDDNSLSNEFVATSEDMTTQQDILEANELEITDQIEVGLFELTTRGFPTRTWANPKGSYPNTLTIDYGTSGVTSPNGHVRKGKIIVQVSAPIKDVGAIRIVSHEDLFIDDVKVEGTVTLTNQGPNSANQYVYLRIVSNRLLTFPSGKTISWNATQILTQLEGGSTPDLKNDDVWSITGFSNGVNRAGKSFSVSTTESLISKFTCRWIVQGIINLTVDTNVLSINFGDGVCNNVAVVTLPDGSTKEVNIRRWW